MLDKSVKILYNIIVLIDDLMLNGGTCSEIGIRDRFGQRYYSGVFPCGCKAG